MTWLSALLTAGGLVMLGIEAWPWSGLLVAGAALWWRRRPPTAGIAEAVDHSPR